MVLDHKKQVYKNYMEMSKAWGISYELFHQRYNIARWPLFEVLETNPEDGVEIRDHEGNLYDTMGEMCSAYEISYPTYRERRLRGWNKRDSLITPPIKPGVKTKCTDNLLELLENISQMTAEDLLNAVQLYQNRKSEIRDVSSAEFEGRPRQKTGPATKPYVDRDGNYFNSLREVCEAYGQPYGLCKHRLFDNWPLQYALECPAGCSSFIDHKGNEFSSLASMCKYYDIDKKVFAERMNNNWTLKDALMLPVEKQPKETDTSKEESL